MDFIITIADQAQLDGITWAREQYNAALPPPPDPPEGEEPPPPATLDTDQDYVQWVMDQAAASYAQQKTDAEWRDAYEAAKTAGRAAAPPPGA